MNLSFEAKFFGTLATLSVAVVIGTSSSHAQARVSTTATNTPKYLRMNFGPALNWTYQVAPGNIAYKGIVIRLDEGGGGVSKGRAWMLYDHDTMRVACAWTGSQFVDWKGIAFDGSHQTHTSILGDKAFINPVGPGWANPQSGNFDDPRLKGRDGNPYGPLPRDWAHFRGTYLHGDQVIIAYTIGDAEILELPGFEQNGGVSGFSRTFNIGKSSHDLVLRVAPTNVLGVLVGASRVQLSPEKGFNVIRIPAAVTPLNLKILVGQTSTPANHGGLIELAVRARPAADLQPMLKGSPPRWNQTILTQGRAISNQGAFAVEVIAHPEDEANPWQSWMRPGGFDFFKDGSRAAVCTWMGEVWLVTGLDRDLKEIKWKRIASGLFQPLGLKIVNETIYVSCRDQVARLHDLNGDDEIDYYENFNNDHQVTEHFHEFAMGLQTDREGNFYYAKSARHALPALVPHHGTLLKVSKDGSKTEVVATGFRAANGVCINDDGTFFVTDQEGHWIPKNRINWVKPGGFYGNMMGYHNRASNADADMEQPLVWITNAMDRSPGELLWVTSPQWGPLKGSLLNLSYGTGRIFLVPHENVDGQLQGGVVQLPIPDFPTGVMRGRFHPQNGHLYVCGLFGWAGNRTRDGGFYRVRYTGQPANLPVALKTYSKGIALRFTDALDPATAADADNYAVKTWSLKRASEYGSKHYNERPIDVSKVTLSQDAKTVQLEIPEIQPTWCMEIKYQLRAANGTPIAQTIHNTIHRLSKSTASATPSVRAFELLTNDCVAFIGGTATVGETADGYLEALLTRCHPRHNLRFRNLGWEGDTVFRQDRPLNFGGLAEHVKEQKATVVFANFGLMESLQADKTAADFKQAYGLLLNELSKITSRIVLISPLRPEGAAASRWKRAGQQDRWLEYVAAIRELVQERDFWFVDLARIDERVPSNDALPFTSNGLHPSPYGHWRLAHEIEGGLGLTNGQWRVEIDAKTKTYQASGTEISKLQIAGSGIRFQSRDAMLPAPVFRKDESNVSVWKGRVLKVTGLRPVRYVLKIDGRKVYEHSHAFWERGWTLARGPELDQSEQLRSAIVEKNQEFFNYWRPQNFAFLKGDLIDQPSSRRHDDLKVRWFPDEMRGFLPIIAEKETAINKLALPAFHTYELMAVE